MDKPALRRHCLRLWQSLDLETLSQNVVRSLLPWLETKGFRHILLYHPLPHELNLLALTRLYPARYYLPKVAGEGLTVHPFGPLTKGPFGLWEPSTEAVDPSLVELVVVPGLAFDTKGYRLGHGKGFMTASLPGSGRKH